MLRVGHDEDRFVCEVSDYGEGLDDRLAGYVPTATGPGLRRSLRQFWVARQAHVAPRVRALTDGHSVRLWL